METIKDKAQDINGMDEHEEAADKETSAGQENIAEKPRGHTLCRICAVAGLLCAIACWLLFYYKPEAAVATACAGVCLTIAGLWSGRGCIRSLSVTGLVASGVLVLVYVAFYWGLAWGVSHL